MTDTVKQILDRLYPDGYMGRIGRVYTDTSDFMRITGGDVIVLAGEHYLVLRDEMERSSGSKIPNTGSSGAAIWNPENAGYSTGVYETFSLSMGDIQIPCYRSPRKEARILDRVRNDPRFMQGFSAEDSAGNNVRVLYVVQGKTPG